MSTPNGTIPILDISPIALQKSIDYSSPNRSVGFLAFFHDPPKDRPSVPLFPTTLGDGDDPRILALRFGHNTSVDAPKGSGGRGTLTLPMFPLMLSSENSAVRAVLWGEHLVFPDANGTRNRARFCQCDADNLIGREHKAAFVQAINELAKTMPVIDACRRYLQDRATADQESGRQPQPVNAETIASAMDRFTRWSIQLMD